MGEIREKELISTYTYESLKFYFSLPISTSIITPCDSLFYLPPGTVTKVELPLDSLLPSPANNEDNKICTRVNKQTLQFSWKTPLSKCRSPPVHGRNAAGSFLGTRWRWWWRMLWGRNFSGNEEEIKVWQAKVSPHLIPV